VAWLSVVVPVLIIVASGLASGCAEPARDQVPDQPGRYKSAASVRADRRAYDGAPPVIPHAPMGASCVQCHNERGLFVEGLGYAPPSPHELTRGMGATARCVQCHVFARTDRLFVATRFDGLDQDMRPGSRLYPGAPPVMPHREFMRENCRACHTGPAAREPIRTSHPERQRCRQCHAAERTRATFQR
jgi:cytochrome c-type protein NapB